MIKLLELFGGIGACSKALERLGIDYEIADYVEIDKYAVASYNAMHGTNFKPQDIREWDKDIKVDLIMHGSPCQDFSIAGNQAGGDKDSGTRSSLMYETIRIVEKLKPKYVIWENVKNLLSKKHIHNFNAYLETMEQLGYINYYQVLNAKDYGIPQNRERVFTVSILNNGVVGAAMRGRYNNGKIEQHLEISNREYANAITTVQKDCLVCEINKQFTFPQKQELKLKLKDMLEDEVDEKYYLSEKMMDYMTGVNQKPSKFPRGERFNQNINRKNQDVANAVTTNAGNRPTDNFIKVKNDTEKSYLKAYKRCGGERMNNLRIRKLTPKECWRLMGFTDEEFERAAEVNSNTQLYKQAGNSIVVNVLEAILINLLLNTNVQDTPKGQLTIFDYL